MVIGIAAGKRKCAVMDEPLERVWCCIRALEVLIPAGKMEFLYKWCTGA
jgi:hypothetical protein